MRICFFWRKRFIAVAVGLLGLASWARAGEVTLTMTVSSSSVSAGDRLSVWLNALNASSEAIVWTFPSRIERRIVAEHGSYSGSLELLLPETNSISIAPGSFARREYTSIMPGAVGGQVVMELPGLNVNRVVLDVAAGSEVAGASVPKTGTAFNRYVKDVEPENEPKGFGPDLFFREHISAYEPMYFIAGTKSPNAKFQISFAYQLVNRDGPLATHVPALKGFHLGYTQLSLWDWRGKSGAFYDTSYKPEIFYAWKNVTQAQPTNWFQLDLQGGLKHESNGKGGADSRSVNIAYLQPTLTIGRDDGLQFSLQPRGWAYLGNRSDNPDIADYRGYADLRAVAGWKHGLQLAALGRMGQDGNHRSLQLDLTYPTMRFLGSFSLYLDVQYFYGYGESLLGYNQKSEALRIGFALFR